MHSWLPASTADYALGAFPKIFGSPSSRRGFSVSARNVRDLNRSPLTPAQATACVPCEGASLLDDAKPHAHFVHSAAEVHKMLPEFYSYYLYRRACVIHVELRFGEWKEFLWGGEGHVDGKS